MFFFNVFIHYIIKKKSELFLNPWMQFAFVHPQSTFGPGKKNNHALMVSGFVLS